MSTIVDIAEIKKVVNRAGKCSDADLGLINMLMPIAEGNIEDYLGYRIAQQTYIEFYPADSDNPTSFYDEDVVEVAGNTVWIGQSGISGNILHLTNTPVRSITNCYVDLTAYFGDTAGAFAVDKLLIAGTDYYLSRTKAGISMNGLLFRRNLNWPTVAGSVKVEYIAGYSEAELGREFAAIKWGVIRTFADLWSRVKALQGGQRADTMASESIGGGVSASYVNEQMRGLPVPDDVVDKLQHLENYSELGL